MAIPLAAVALLGLSAAVSLAWSHYMPLSLDEFYVLHTDSVGSLGEVVRIQRAYPLSLDPLVYHAIAHISIRAFGAIPFALRLPSILGYLTMQMCLFLFVRRIATERAALLAMALPVLAATDWYSVQGRPYGLLLGFCGLAMVSWQTAVRSEVRRTGALVTLAAAVGLTLNTHYFGVLLLAPLCLAELYRSVERRRVDVPVATAIGAGTACVVFVLPFLRAAGEFRQHYAILDQVSFRDITRNYRWLLLDYTHYDLGTQKAIAMGLLAVTVLLLWGLVWQIREKTLNILPAEAVFVVLLAGLPIFGYLLARYVTHVIELKYVLCAIVGMAALAAIGASPLLRSRWAGWAVLGAMFVTIAWTGVTRAVGQRAAQQELQLSMVIAPEIKAAVMASPTQLLYIQDLYYFDLASYYEPDLEMRSRLALMYSREQELRWDHHDTISLNALHMRVFTPCKIVPYEQLKQVPGEHVFMLMGGIWDWTDQAFAADGVKVRPLGTVFGREAAGVRFPVSGPAAQVGRLSK